MYRASYEAVSVTSNGVRIAKGTGKYQVRYFYSHPDLVPHHGRRVAVFFNDYDPDTDAVVYSIQNGKLQNLICVAPRRHMPDRLGASETEMRAEATLKSQMMNVARTERASMAPYLQRSFKTSAAQAKAGEVDYQLKAARKENGKRIQSRSNLAKFQGDASELLTTKEPRNEEFSQQAPQGESVVISPNRGASRDHEIPDQVDFSRGDEGLSGKTTAGEFEDVADLDPQSLL
jgi:hypothetical protein